MSLQELTRLSERVASDRLYLEEFILNPETLLGTYDLSLEEREAVLRGDESKVVALGVDPRISKRMANN